MNQMLKNTIDSCLAKVAAMPRTQEWEASFAVVDNKVSDISVDLNDEISDALWRAVTIYAEEMFKLGWELRGDPTKLFDLPDGG